MNITKESYVSLSYTLTVDGEIVENVEASKPLDFIFGIGMLLPKFEENLDNKKVGDTFKFTLTPEEGYGEIVADAIVELPKNVFEFEGAFDAEIVKVGEVLPMMDNQGHQMMGLVKEVKDDVVVMDFNSPMAGKTLNFEGAVVGVRKAIAEDYSKFMPQGGCSCGSDCDSDCGGGCGDQEGCCK